MTTHMDPYMSDIDYKVCTDGWFVKTMPDLNQDNPLVLNYLIQNSIWWVETADLDGSEWIPILSILKRVFQNGLMP